MGLIYMYLHDIKGISYTSGSSYSWNEVYQFYSDLKLPKAGLRGRTSGDRNNLGSDGCYWSSSPNSYSGFRMHLEDSYVSPNTSSPRAYGFSVRCFKN
jgi:hypothetical protein